MIRETLFPKEILMDNLNNGTLDLSIFPVCNGIIIPPNHQFLPFGPHQRPEAMCPFCKSLERHRVYAMYFKLSSDLLSRQGLKILHFAPELGLSKMLSNPDLQHDYYPVDFNPNYKGYIRMVVDITNIPFPDDFFDVVIANHVIEHIPDEKQALSEVERVLKRDGFAFINTPVFNRETTLEDSAYNTPELREKYYGQYDHVRKYGKDYIDRLKSVFPHVEAIDYCAEFSQEERRLYHLPNPGSIDSMIYLCEKVDNTSSSSDSTKSHNYLVRGLQCYRENGITYTIHRIKDKLFNR